VQLCIAWVLLLRLLWVPVTRGSIRVLLMLQLRRHLLLLWRLLWLLQGRCVCAAGLAVPQAASSSSWR
jgi:hypothetical protein